MIKNIFMLSLVMLIMYGCTSKKIQTTTSDNKFCIPDSILSGITTDSVKYMPLLNEFNLIGKVTFDQDKVAKLYPMASGNVHDVKVALGDHVEKGQILAVISSTEIKGAENDIVAAESNLAVSEKNLASIGDMYKGGIVSEKEYITAQKETEKARSELDRAKTVLSIYGGKQAEYIVKSPISGFIVEKNVNPGMQIRPDNTTNLFTISNLKKIWILASVFETEISYIKIGEKVDVTTLTYPGKIFTGTIDKVYNVLDPDSKTMNVRIQLDNNDLLLKPEMFANVRVHQITDSTMLAVPAKSVVFDKNKYWVVIYKNKCDVKASEIDIAGTAGTYTYVRSGVQPGDKVITNLQLLIFNALN